MQTPASREVKLALCTVSGGFDSAAALLWCLERWPTQAVFVSYGQRYWAQEHRALQYLVEQPVIHDHPNWRHLSSVSADMTLMPPKNPWIPYRNLVIASLMANVAVGRGAQVVVFGSKSASYRPSDPISYLDSTIQFYRALEALIVTYTEPQNVERCPVFELPLVGQSKVDVLRYIKSAGLDLTKLWNCYREDNGPEPCGVCEHCTITQPLVAQVMAEDGTGGGGVENIPTTAEGAEAL